jgi:PAS domain S-box-containing protein
MPDGEERAAERLRAENEGLREEIARLRRELGEPARHAQRRSEEEKRLILDSVDEVVLYTDPDLRVVWVNRAGCAVAGRDREEIVGRRCYEIWGEGREPCPDCVAQAAMRSGQEQRVESVRPDGRAWLMRGYPVFGADGAVVGGIEVGLDVTERRRAEEEVRRLEGRSQVARRLQSLGVLAGGIAHDFNNILTVVLGNAELGETKLPPGAAARRHLSEIVAASKRAARLCQQMLAYAGKGRLVLERVDLAETVRSLVELLRGSLGGEVRLDVAVTPGLPPIEADAAQVRQVLLELVSNASESIGDGPGVITVGTSLVPACSGDGDGRGDGTAGDPAAPGPYARLEVSDTGRGMPPEVLERMFEPFYSTGFPGRGLGMAAVRGIVKAHGGDIRVSSAPGRGTAVRVLLPISAGEPSPGEEDVPDPGWRGRGTVLVVDDEEGVRAVARGMLEALGFHVLAVHDGRSAIAVFRARWREVDAVLLDLTMPVLGGEETLRELLAIDPAARVVVSSGYEESDVSGRLAGKSGFLGKPYRLEELREAFRRVL